MSAWAKHWQRAEEWIRGHVSRRWERLLAWRGRWRPREDSLHLALAGVVGILGGLTNAVFHDLTEILRGLFTGRPAYGGGPSNPGLDGLRLFVPIAGALMAGLVLRAGQRLLRTGATNLLEVVVAGDGRLPFRPNLIRAISSLISVASGASVGREGSITQMAATLASKVGQAVRWPPYRLRLLVACGAAAGMAAAYNAPIAGAVFAAQIVLGNFSMNLFAPLMFSSVIAAVVSRTFFGIEPLYRVPEFEFTRILQLPWFVVLGAGAGVLGAVFLKLLQVAERAFQRLNQPIHVRLTLAGVVVAGLAVVIPEVWGNGYSVASRILENAPDSGITWKVIGLLLMAKLAATVITVGAGTVGGVFTPTLFLGVALGSLAGQVLDSAGLAMSLPVGAFALAGMGSVLAATTHSPLLAMIMVFEISLNYSMMPALMLACAVGTLVSRRLHATSVYTEPLQRIGVLGEAEAMMLGVATQRKVGDLMREPVPPVPETATFKELGQRFLTTSYNYLPVVDAAGRLTGLVALQDLKGYLNAGHELQAVIAFDVMRPPPPCVMPSQLLHEALPLLLATELRHIPVVTTLTERRLVGTLVRSEALGVLSEALAPKGTPDN